MSTLLLLAQLFRVLRPTPNPRPKAAFRIRIKGECVLPLHTPHNSERKVDVVLTITHIGRVFKMRRLAVPSTIYRELLGD